MWLVGHMSVPMAYFQGGLVIHTIPIYDSHATWDRLWYIVVIQSKNKLTVTIGGSDSLMLSGSPNTPS